MQSVTMGIDVPMATAGVGHGIPTRRPWPVFRSLAVITPGLLAAWAATADAPQPADRGSQIEPAAKVIKYGLFEVTRAGHLKEDPRAPTGKVLHNPVLAMAEETDRVPLKLGVHFGYRYHLQFPTDVRAVDLKRVMLHPPLTRPDGTSVNRSERTLRKRVYQGFVTGVDGYAFHEPYELAQGEWVFQLWYRDRLLLEQRFETERFHHPAGSG